MSGRLVFLRLAHCLVLIIHALQTGAETVGASQLKKRVVEDKNHPHAVQNKAFPGISSRFHDSITTITKEPFT